MNNSEEEFLKVIDDFYGFKIEERKEQSSATNPIDVCSGTNDGDSTYDESIREKDPYVHSSTHTMDSDATDNDAPAYINDLNTLDAESIVEEAYPPININHSKEPEVYKVIDDQDGIMDDPILEKRLDPGTPAKKMMGTQFLTFRLNDIKISA